MLCSIYVEEIPIIFITTSICKLFIVKDVFNFSIFQKMKRKMLKLLSILLKKKNYKRDNECDVTSTNKSFCKKYVIKFVVSIAM